MLKRSAALLLRVALLTGVGNGGAALRALARDAAVGANRPDEGVFGREVVPDGVFEWASGVVVDEGVLGRLGVVLNDDLDCLMPEKVEVGPADLVDVPVCCGLRGWDLGGLRGEFWGGERICDFGGVLAAADVLGAGPLAGVEVAFRTGGDLVFAVDGLGVFVGSAVGCGTTSAAEDLAGPASMTGGDLGCDTGETRIEDGFSSVAVDFGGHSLFCIVSSLAESPVICDTTLVLRGNPMGS